MTSAHDNIVTPPQSLRVTCASGFGAGIAGSIHMTGNWSRQYLIANGDLITSVLVTLQKLKLNADRLSSSDILAIDADILRIQIAQNPELVS